MASLSFCYSPEGFTQIKGERKYSLHTTDAAALSDGFPYIKWDLGPASFIAANDRHGLGHLFYFHSKDQGFLAVATSLRELSSHLQQVRLDYPSILLFLSIGSYLGNTTPLKDVEVLGPDGQIVISAGVPTIAEQIHWPKAVDQKQHTRDQLIESYIEHFGSSMSRLGDTHLPLRITLSGGRDSRHIFLEAVRQQLEIQQVVNSTSEAFNNGAEDTAVAELLCDRAGLPLQVVSPTQDYLGRENTKNFDTHFCTMQHAWYTSLQTDNLQHTVLADGLAGDILSESKRFNPQINQWFLDSNESKLADTLLHKINSIRSAIEFPTNMWPDDDVLREKVLSECRKFYGLQMPHAAFLFYNQTRRNTSLAAQCLSGHRQIYFPYLDRRLFQFLASGAMQRFPDNDFHSQTIKRAYPEFSDIPYSGTNKQRRPDISHRRRRARSLRRYYQSTLYSSIRLQNGPKLRRNYAVTRLLKGLAFPHEPTPLWLTQLHIYLSGLSSLEKR